MAEDENMIGYDPLAWMSEPEADDANSDRNENTDGVDTLMSGEDNGGVALDEAQALSLEAGPDFPPNVEETEADMVPVVSSSVGDLVLEPVQTIQNVVQLHQQLEALLDSSEKIDIDASAVTQIDTATLQLLLVLKMTAAKLQKEVNIDFPSERFLEAAQLLGVAEMLSVDQAAAGFF